MINTRISTAEAAQWLGVKPATVYAYVSRGLLRAERGPGGSTFDRQDVARLARSSRRPGLAGHGRPRHVAEAATAVDPAFVTELTTISEGRLWYRGVDAAELARAHSLEEAAEWLWTSRPPQSGPPPPWRVRPGVSETIDAMLRLGPADMAPVERLVVAVVAARMCDELRYDLSPSGVPVTARSLLAAMATALPLARRGARSAAVAERVWRGLTPRRYRAPDERAMRSALVLGADHELAPTTLAARVAASFRADPYAVVLTGLGPAGGSWEAGSTGAPGEVEALLAEAERVGAERAVGERLRRRARVPHGFGMPLYPEGDPRAGELLRALDGVGDAGRAAVVSELLDVGRRREFPPPNFDLALGALAFQAEMVPGAGQAIFTFAKTVGWLAHAMEEYADPTRFRSRADYVGPAPGEGIAGSLVTGTGPTPKSQDDQ